MEYYGIIHPDFCEFLRLRSTARTDYARYYAFPAILPVGEKLLIAYKDGVAHGWEREGAEVRLEQAVLDIPSQRVERVDTLYASGDRIPQMGEYVQMPNGDVCVYIDMQDRSASARRTGMEALRSADGGQSYRAEGRVGAVGGVEYGYPLNFCERDGRVYMAAMTFPNLEGSEGRRQVHVISSADSGASWQFEANLTRDLGLEFNECALVSTDEGFALFTRGEAPRHAENAGTDGEAPARLVMLDGRFRPLRMRDYRATRGDFSQVGRPRLYERSGRLLLITRQHVRTAEGIGMTLDLFALDPQSLEVRGRIRLCDPVAGDQDGHYASLYFDSTHRPPMLRAVDYLTCPTPANPSVKRKPDIVQFSFDLDALAAQFKEETGYDL